MVPYCFTSSMVGVIVPIGLTGLVSFALWIWAVFDVIASESMLVRNLPKGTWLFVVIFIPTVGAIAWLLLGRPVGAGASLGGQPASYEDNPWRSATRGFEDSPEWKSSTQPSRPDQLAGVSDESLAVRERKLLEREAELAKREAEVGLTEQPSAAADADARADNQDADAKDD